MLGIMVGIMADIMIGSKWASTILYLTFAFYTALFLIFGLCKYKLMEKYGGIYVLNLSVREGDRVQWITVRVDSWKLMPELTGHNVLVRFKEPLVIEHEMPSGAKGPELVAMQDGSVIELKNYEAAIIQMPGTWDDTFHFARQRMIAEGFAVTTMVGDAMLVHSPDTLALASRKIGLFVALAPVEFETRIKSLSSSIEAILDDNAGQAPWHDIQAEVVHDEPIVMAETIPAIDPMESLVALCDSMFATWNDQTKNKGPESKLRGGRP